MGMMAGPGVIDKVAIEPHTGVYRIRTIENKPPIGICGSGLIDLVAQLFQAGMIDLQGRYVESNCRNRLKKIDGIEHLVVVFSQDSATGEDLTLSQTDIDALMRSKAAMYTILNTITCMINVSLEDVENFSFLGLREDIAFFIDPATLLPLQISGKLPKLGTLHLKLSEVEVRRFRIEFSKRVNVFFLGQLIQQALFEFFEP